VDRELEENRTVVSVTFALFLNKLEAPYSARTCRLLAYLKSIFGPGPVVHGLRSASHPIDTVLRESAEQLWMQFDSRLACQSDGIFRSADNFCKGSRIPQSRVPHNPCVVLIVNILVCRYLAFVRPGQEIETGTDAKVRWDTSTPSSREPFSPSSCKRGSQQKSAPVQPPPRSSQAAAPRSMAVPTHQALRKPRGVCREKNRKTLTVNIGSLPRLTR
jgi:hypothetical protein